METEIFPIGTSVLAEDYDGTGFVVGLVTGVRNKRFEMPYEITWCDGDSLVYSFDQVLEMNNDYKTQMGLW